MQILSRIFRAKRTGSAHCDDELDRMVRRVLVLNPRLRHARDHDERLRSALAHSMNYLGELVAAFPPPRSVSARTWSSDPYIRAFFAKADDVGDALSRSADLHRFFEQAPALNETCAVLGMEMSERRILGVSTEGGVMRSDVPQTTLSFGDHQLRICGSTMAALRDEIVGRLVDQMSLEALALIAQEGERRDMLERERALLAARLRILQHQGTGMRSVAGGDTQGDAAQRARLGVLMDENDRDLRGLGLLSDAFDRQLECFCQVFAQPAKRIHVRKRRVRLNRMNVLVADDTPDDEAHTLELEVALVPGDPPRERAVALVRVARADVPRPVNVLEQAERLLG